MTAEAWHYIVILLVATVSIVAAMVATEQPAVKVVATYLSSSLKSFFAALGYLVFWHLLLPITCRVMKPCDGIKRWRARRKARWLVRHGFAFMGQISEHLLPEDER